MATSNSSLAARISIICFIIFGVLVITGKLIMILLILITISILFLLIALLKAAVVYLVILRTRIFNPKWRGWRLLGEKELG